MLSTQQECEKLLLNAQRQCEELLIEGQRKSTTLLIAAEEGARGITQAAQDGGKRIVETAMQHADTLVECAQAELEKLKQKRQTRLQQIRDSHKIVDAARKKALYWGTSHDASGGSTASGSTSVCSTLGKRVRTSTSSALEVDPDVALDCPSPNRKRRCITTVTTDVVRYLLEKVTNFNYAAKKAVLARLWRHAALKPYQPALLGSPKLDSSISAALTEMRKTLSIVKTARRKDHLAAKYQILSGFVGQSTVQQRLQTTLATALGIRRHNLHRASKIRAHLDSDASKAYPMGERRVRCDKISDAVRKLVQQYWDSHTRISPCKNNFARKRLGRKDYEQHQVHWLEETQVTSLNFAPHSNRSENTM